MAVLRWSVFGVFSMSALFLATGDAAFAQDKPSFQCTTPSFHFPAVQEFMKKRGKSVDHQRIVHNYVSLSDLKTMRAGCTAFRDKKPFAYGCLNGRRDFDAISLTLPPELNSWDKPRAKSELDRLNKIVGKETDEVSKFCLSVEFINR